VSVDSAILVADSSDQRRREFGLALYKGGYEVINAVNGEEALRFTAGLDPTLVIAHTGLDGMDPLDLCRRVKATGLDVPPMLILSDEPVEIPDDLEQGNFYSLRTSELDSSTFLNQIRLLLLARYVGGELNDTIDRLYGDLTRIAIGDLLRVLLRSKVTGHVSLTLGPDTGLWFNEGEIVDAHWAGISGRKAFNRIAGLRGGAFNLTLDVTPRVRSIDIDLATLVTDAVEEKFQLDELFRRMPSFNSRVEVRMAGDFFTTEFTDVERAVLTSVQKARNLADLVDRIPATDLEVLRAVEALHEREILVFVEPEHRIHVVTDSTCDLAPPIIRRLGITVVPLSVIFGKKVFKDGIDLMPDEFYSMLRESEVFPSTSPPGKGEFLETYRHLVGTGDIISLHISAAQSLTFAHAEEAATEGEAEFRQIREEAGFMRATRIRVVDTRSNSVGLGMLVRFASRLARRGLSVDEIAERIESIAGRLQFLFLVDTLEYLRKGGRIGGARAFLGTLLGIKPILSMEGGEVQAVDKARGGRKAQPKLIELLKQRVNPSAPVFAVVAHASAPKWAGRLRELVEGAFTIEEMLEGDIGPIVGAHAGPGTVGCVLFAPEPEEMELLRAIEG
jgi:DegV family protein with EDD domain